MANTSRPPIPRKLREMFKDYPQHVERLQEALEYVTQTSSDGVDPFDRAIWVLEGRLAGFIADAKNELRSVETEGDADALEKARDKERLMSKARSVNGGMADLSDLLAFSSGRRGV